MWRALIFLSLIGFSKCQIRDIRLVGGLHANEGRVEILYESQDSGTSWGTICDDGWSLDDAKVVCRQLGLPEAVAAPTDAYFGRGLENSHIWFNDVKCHGGESSLNECNYNDYQPSVCIHSEDAGAVCGSPKVTNVVLTNWTGVFTSPGYPQHMERAHYEWAFDPPSSYEIAVICFEYFDIRHDAGATIKTDVYVEDAKGKYPPFEHKSAECVHIMDNPGKVVFNSPLTSPKGGKDRGFRARYVIIDRASNEHPCKDWDITANGDIGRIQVEWKPPKKFTKSDYTYIFAYNSTPDVIDIEITNLTSVVVEYLNPNTEYTVHVLALPLTRKPGMRWDYCAKQIFTSNLRTRLHGREKPNEGFIEVFDKDQWLDVCQDFMWDFPDASVACRSAGMKPPLYFTEFLDDSGNKKDSRNTKTIGTDNQSEKQGLWFLKCSKSDKSLLDCPVLFKWSRPCRINAPVVCVQDGV